ncbi:hypothetical protein N0561_26985, partial [Pseudomonas aeruginosa]|nr:hypothetical protein [Pseudomonas aeruginosa]
MADLLFVEVHSAFFKASEENFFSRASNASLDSLPPAFSIAAAFPPKRKKGTKEKRGQIYFPYSNLGRPCPRRSILTPA